jgi:threonine dehydrogenase-like Zn-dependent dehydrogenase
VIDPAAHDMVAAIAELTHGEGAHKTLDASSAPDARAAAVRSVRAARRLFVGERGQVTLDVSADLLRRQVMLVGSWTFSKQGQAECAEFIAERKVDVERLHAPLAARAGRGSLPALRHADDRQGRHPAVVTSGGPDTASAGCSSERE